MYVLLGNRKDPHRGTHLGIISIDGIYRLETGYGHQGECPDGWTQGGLKMQELNPNT